MSGRGSLAISTGTGVFLSYARRDDESFAEFLASQLRSRGLVVWRDREAMASRGRSFRQEIREAISASERLVLVIGPQAARSRQVRAEWRQAYESCKVVVPILRLGDKSLIPDDLTELHFVDARAPRPPQEIVAELTRILGDPIQPLGALFGVDKPPEHLVQRPEELDRLKGSVLADLAGPVVITSSQQTVALQGMGGLGKSVLAAVLARSCPVRRAFGDGVIWVRVGQQGDVVAALRLVGRALGDHDPSGYLDVATGKGRLMELLADRVCLLVLDDLWDVTHAEAFRDALGERCRLLITTRDGSLVSALGAKEQRLDLLSAEQARTLLASLAGRNPSALPPQALQVLEECGNLPFAIALSGAMARDGVPWTDLLEALREADLAFVEQRLPNYPYPDVLRSLQASIDMLRQRDPAAARRYLELGVFPAGVAVPEAAVLVLWQRADDLSDRDARALLARLERNALLRLEGTAPNRTVTLHDLQYDYLRAVASDPARLQQQLLDGYRRHCPDGWASGHDDGYFFQRLPYHLLHAGRAGELHQLLLDFDWLQAKLTATGPVALVADFDLLPSDLELRLVRDALRLSAHVLARDAGQLPSQLHGRLPTEQRPAVQAMLAQARTRQHRTWLRPIRSSLAAPGEPLARTLEGHEGIVLAMAVTPDGQRAVSASADKTLIVWDLLKGVAERTLTGHTGSVLAVAITPDSRRVMSGSSDHTARVWDLDSSEMIQVLGGHGGSVAAVAITPDGRRAVTASAATLQVWDLERGAVLWTLAGHLEGYDGDVNAIALTPDGRQVVSASNDATLVVWDLEQGKAQRTLGPPPWRLGREITTPDGRRGTQFDDDLDRGTRVVIDVDTTQELYRLPGHLSRIWAVALTTDGQRAVSASEDTTLRVWDLASGAELHVLRGHTGQVSAVVVTPAGRYAVSGSDDQTVRSWDLATGQLLRTFEGHSFDINSLAVTPDGSKVVSGSSDQTIRVWDLARGVEVLTLRAHTGSVGVVAVTPDSRYAVSGSNDNTLRLWDLTAPSRPDGNRHLGQVNAAAITADGRRAVTAAGAGSPLAAADNTLKVWDTTTGTELATLNGHLDEVWAVTITPDGRRAVSGSDDHTVRVWDLAGRAPQIVLEGHTQKIWDLQVTPDGDHIISASGDGDLRVWDLGSGRGIWTLRGHDGFVNRVRVTPAGRHAISSSEDRTVRVWDLREGALVRTLRGHEDQTYALALTPDGRRIVSGSGDRTVRVWDLASGATLATFDGHTGVVTDLVVTADGRKVISASGFGDHALRIWDLEHMKQVRTLRGHTAYVSRVMLLPSNRQLLSASLDGTVRLWSVHDGTELATFVADSPVHSCVASSDGLVIVAGEKSGRVHVLTIEGSS
jgi:WD40 repeat protein